MELSPTARKALLAATAWLPLYVCIFMCATFSITVGTSLRAESGGDPSWLPAVLSVIFPLHFLTILLSLVVTGIYVYLVMTRYVGDETERLMWILVVLLGSFFGQLVFFRMKLWPVREGHGAGAGSA